MEHAGSINHLVLGWGKLAESSYVLAFPISQNLDILSGFPRITQGNKMCKRSKHSPQSYFGSCPAHGTELIIIKLAYSFSCLKSWGGCRPLWPTNILSLGAQHWWWVSSLACSQQGCPQREVMVAMALCKPQNHRMLGVRASPSPTPLPEQEHLEWVAQNGFEWLQRRRLYNRSGQPGSVL